MGSHQYSQIYHRIFTWIITKNVILHNSDSASIWDRNGIAVSNHRNYKIKNSDLESKMDRIDFLRYAIVFSHKYWQTIILYNYLVYTQIIQTRVQAMIQFFLTDKI